jgi:hypothetical protein
MSGDLALGDPFNYLAYDVVAKHMLSEDGKFFGQLQAIRDTVGRMLAARSDGQGAVEWPHSGDR